MIFLRLSDSFKIPGRALFLHAEYKSMLMAKIAAPVGSTAQMAVATFFRVLNVMT